MQEFYALHFYEIAHDMEYLRAQMRMKSFTSAAGDKTVARVFGMPIVSGPLSEEDRNALISVIPRFHTRCKDIGLQISMDTAMEIFNRLSNGNIQTYEHAERALTQLDSTIRSEMRNNLFMFIPKEDAVYFNQPELFGSDITAKWPKLQSEIKAAGTAYACGCSTACVFHLMRIMEAVIQEWGNALGVPLVDEKEWQKVLDGINGAIRGMPPKDERTILYSQCASHLYNVKVAWRNPTMHPKASYMPKEAKQVMDCVRTFLEHFATII